MDMKIVTGLNRIVSLLILAVAISISLLSCGHILKQHPPTPVPSYRYPGNDKGENIHLVSILTNPYAESFKQGNLLIENRKSDKAPLRPVSVAVGIESDLYILDYGRGVVYRMDYDHQGNLNSASVIPRSNRSFPSAVDMALAPTGRIWVVDSKLKTVFILAPEGKIVDSIIGYFSRPVGVAYHPTMDKILVTDLASDEIYIFETNGTFVRAIGKDNELEIESPSFITVGPDGIVYVVEALTAKIKLIGQDWSIKSSFGGAGDGPGFFAKPKGIAVDKKGRIYVVDALFDNVQIFDKNARLLLTIGTTGSGAGQFWQPMGITVDSTGRVFVADSYNRRVEVFSWNEEL